MNINGLLTGALLPLVVLLALSAFFSASETAITASGRSKILALMERYPYQKRFFDWLLKDVQRVLTIALISNNLVNVAASAVGTSLAIALLGQKGLLAAVVVMSVLIVIFGEVFPKCVAVVHPDSLMAFSLPLLRFLDILLAPFLWLTLQMMF